jgi:hypothetical protein
MTPIRFALLASLALLTTAAVAQENVLVTQTLVHADSKADIVPTAASINLQINNKTAPLTSLAPIKPSGIQIALLIDDGLSRSAGIQLNDLKSFAATLPPQIELLVGYMSNGTVRVLSPFSTDHAAAADVIRLPSGLPGQSASPYFCLSDFVKNWPADESGNSAPKARIVMMVTNGVDPYNGSTRLDNQDSPYGDAGIRGGSASFSGQSYLQQVADATGGETYYEGTGNPVSLTPFFKQFLHTLTESYIATFNVDPAAGGREHLVRVKMSTNIPKVKIRHPDEVRPGNLEAAPAAAQ